MLESIEYEAGNEHSPTDDLGRVLLLVEANGRVRLEHHGRAGARVWAARTDPSFLERLETALQVAGFPDIPPSRPRSGERMRSLHVVGDAGGQVLLPWYDVTELPGYADAFQLVDAMVTALGGPAVGARDLVAITDVHEIR